MLFRSIYGTRPWRVYGEGPTRVKGGMFTDTERTDFTGRDIRFTTRGDVLYAIVLAWPGAEAIIRSLSPDLRLYSGEVVSVELLGSNEKLPWTRDEGGLKVKMPAQKPCDYAFVLKITTKPADGRK